MTNEQRKAIDNLSEIVKLSKEELQKENENITAILDYKDLKSLDTVLSLIKEQQEEIELIKEYVHQEIVHYTETIEDYEDDDKKENKHYIEELKEKREHWKDIEKILKNKPKKELYMNWWKYGLYE